eukprot:g2574.t1
MSSYYSSTSGFSDYRSGSRSYTNSASVGPFEIIKDRLYVLATKREPRSTSSAFYFSTDHDLVYWNFFLDFGPLNLAQSYRFCQLLNSILKDPEHRGKKIYYYSGLNSERRANSATLMGIWQMIFLKRTPAEAYSPFRSCSFPAFHDASPCQCTYKLSVKDCLDGFYKAMSLGFFDYNTFDADEYEKFEKVEYGDLSWLRYDKFCAFAGPHNVSSPLSDNYVTLTPEHYIPYFKKKNVTMVIRLNKKYYDKKKFTSQGIQHTDLYFLDGSTPSDKIIRAFLKVCEASKPGHRIAVHCKAGLGRTGSLCGCFFMKHYGFTAAEFIGWVRICRPGSVIGPQQHFLREMQQSMWMEGKAWREKRGIKDVKDFLKKELYLSKTGGSFEDLVSKVENLSLSGSPGIDFGSSPYDSSGNNKGSEASQGDFLRQSKSPKGRASHFNRELQFK